MCNDHELPTECVGPQRMVKQASVSVDSSSARCADSHSTFRIGGREMGARDLKIPSCSTCSLTRKAYPTKDAGSGGGRRTFII
jgi:hypothetical protein